MAFHILTPYLSSRTPFPAISGHCHFTVLKIRAPFIPRLIEVFSGLFSSSLHAVRTEPKTISSLSLAVKPLTSSKMFSWKRIQKTQSFHSKDNYTLYSTSICSETVHSFLYSKVKVKSVLQNSFKFGPKIHLQVPTMNP